MKAKRRSIHFIIFCTLCTIYALLNVFVFIIYLNVVNNSPNTNNNLVKEKNISTIKMGYNSMTKSSYPNKTKGLSACLLIKDENHNLIEWLAYHYTTIPLQYLIIAIDPNSMSSPLSILNRWKHYMNITIWNDRDYLSDHLQGAVSWNTISSKGYIVRHHMRQNWFLSKCMRHHKVNGRDWTILIDVDEFLIFNSIDADDMHPYFMHNDTTTASTTFSLNYKSMHDTNMTKYIDYFNGRIKLPKPPIPKNDKLITISEYIQNYKNKIPFKTRSCILFPRLVFGTIEETNQSTLNESIHKLPFVDPMKFNTLRYFRHARKGNEMQNKRGKPMVDVSRIPLQRFNSKANYPHCPLRQCGTSEYVNYNISLFRIHHYVTSKESYFASSNKRRTIEMYNSRGANVNDGTCYDIQPWLKHFVDRVGLEDARFLLDGVGDVDDNLKHPEDKNAIPATN